MADPVADVAHRATSVPAPRAGRLLYVVWSAVLLA
jgi:hypothetical protein